MAKNGPITIPINSLKDGVGRQAPSKRLPTEAEDLTNVLVTMENSAEKRPGTVNIPTMSAKDGVHTDRGDLELPTADDMFHYWFDLTPETAYLVSVDYKGSGNLIHVHGMQHATTNDELPQFYKVQEINPDQSVIDYVRYGNSDCSAKDALRIIALGPRLLILNTKVSTGYTSDDDGKLFGLDGIVTTDDDTLGAPIEYLTSIATDPEGTATVYVQNKAYAGGAEVYVPGLAGNVIYKAIDALTASDNDASALTDVTKFIDTGRVTAQIPVQDFRYPDSGKAYLGQSVNDITELKLPPASDDHLAANGAEAELAALYPDDLGAGENGRGASDGGKGKIYYIANGYGGSEPGYYIVRSTTAKPYLKQIRTPEAYSLPAANRLPAVVTASADKATSWTCTHGDYDPRNSGEPTTNPGPTVWKDGRQTQITSMALFRNRLFFAADDAVFSSRLNDFGNFFLEDPSAIVDTDPIDISLSSNKYTPISTLTPFESFMFINTTADVQFSLQGSENQITPFTAEISSASFYSTAPLTEPILLGSQIYFFDRRRMYVFFNDRQISIQRSIEVSQHCPNYLPETYGAVATSPAYDTIMMVDDAVPTDVYMYTNRYRGDQVVQNAFFKYSFSHEVISFYPYEDKIFMLCREDGVYFLQQMQVQEDNSDALFLDDANKFVVTADNTSFDANTNTTTFTFDGVQDFNNDLLMIGYDLANHFNGTTLNILEKTNPFPGTIVLKVSGQWDDQIGRVLYYGKTYEMKIKLSRQFARDENNNVQDGVLSLRTMHTRHANSGGYRVEKTVRNRKTISTDYDPYTVGDIILDDTKAVETTGETVAKIFGYSDETSIEIVSDTPNPVNITQIMLKGMFRGTYSSFVR